VQGWVDDTLIHIHRSIIDLKLFIVNGTNTPNNSDNSSGT